MPMHFFQIIYDFCEKLGSLNKKSLIFPFKKLNEP